MAEVVIRAIYEDGVFKPLEPLELSERQIVELRVEPTDETRPIVKLGGSWAQYAADLSYEDIQGVLHDSHAESLQRLLRQIDGETG